MKYKQKHILHIIKPSISLKYIAREYKNGRINLEDIFRAISRYLEHYTNKKEIAIDDLTKEPFKYMYSLCTELKYKKCMKHFQPINEDVQLGRFCGNCKLALKFIRKERRFIK